MSCLCKGCTGNGFYGVTLKQMQRTAAASEGFEFDETKTPRVVCAAHKDDVIIAHISQRFRDAGGSHYLKPRDLIKAILHSTGTHEKSPAPES